MGEIFISPDSPGSGQASTLLFSVVSLSTHDPVAVRSLCASSNPLCPELWQVASSNPTGIMLASLCLCRSGMMTCCQVLALLLLSFLPRAAAGALAPALVPQSTL